MPSSKFDTLLTILKKVKLIDGMSTEEHQNIHVGETIGIFEEAGFHLKRMVKVPAWFK